MIAESRVFNIVQISNVYLAIATKCFVKLEIQIKLLSEPHIIFNKASFLTFDRRLSRYMSMGVLPFFSSYVGLGVASTVHLQNISVISGTQKNI